MIEDENIVLKNRIAELKQRLSNIYAESFMDINKSKIFENEFSLYLKASGHARNERDEGIRLQNDVVKRGLTVLVASSALTLYLFNTQILFGMLVLLGLGFLACGFTYLLLAAEIRILRAGGYCAELETYFKRYRWSSEHGEKLNLPPIPLWEEYRSSWNKDLYEEGHYGKAALYAPFRIAISLIDVLALAIVMYSFVTRHPEISWIMLTASCTLWVAAVIVQMFLVHAMINTVDAGLEKREEFRKKEISFKPGTWVNLLRLFFALDILSPKSIRDKDLNQDEQ